MDELDTYSLTNKILETDLERIVEERSYNLQHMINMGAPKLVRQPNFRIPHTKLLGYNDISSLLFNLNTEGNEVPHLRDE